MIAEGNLKLSVSHLKGGKLTTKIEAKYYLSSKLLKFTQNIMKQISENLWKDITKKFFLLSNYERWNPAFAYVSVTELNELIFCSFFIHRQMRMREVWSPQKGRNGGPYANQEDSVTWTCMPFFDKKLLEGKLWVLNVS